MANYRLSASTRPHRKVGVLWRGGEVDTIFGFEKEADALQWIKGEVTGMAD
jgi:hypothetical protein